MIPLALALTILSGVPESIHDGDSLRLNGERVRLAGLDAPELEESCIDAAGAPYPAGVVSRDSLRALIGGAPITCTFAKRDRYGRAISACGGLNEAMVRDGMAEAAYGEQYRLAEQLARAEGKGIWQGACEQPWIWRKTR